MAGNLSSGETKEGYVGIPGFCKATDLEDIASKDFVLTPGRYVGTAEQEEDDEPFADKMNRLTAELKGYLEESAKLEKEIKKQLGGLGYEV